MYRGLYSGPSGCLIQLPRHRELEYRGAQGIPYDRIVVFWKCEPEDQDRLDHPRLAKLHSLFHGRDRESPQIIVILDLPRDLYRAVSVPVGLNNPDHTHAFGEVRFHITEILLHRSKVDPGVYSCMLHGSVLDSIISD